MRVKTYYSDHSTLNILIVIQQVLGSFISRSFRGVGFKMRKRSKLNIMSCDDTLVSEM